jgi:uncharacterized phage infection (PIP) family protein YhgE
MNGEGDGYDPVRYDPEMTSTRRERDTLKLELVKRESREKEMSKRIRKLERRLNEVTNDDKRILELKAQIVKKDKRMEDIQKYLKKLPTMDEYHQCLSTKDKLKSENTVLSKNFREIKEKLGPYIEKVQTMKKQNLQLEEEMKSLIKINEELEDKLCLIKNDSGKENKSDLQLMTELEEHKTIETNLLIRLKKEREERAIENER